MLTLQKKLRVPSFGRKASSTKRAAPEGGNSAGGIRASSSHRSQQFTLADFSGRVRWACSASSCRARRRVHAATGSSVRSPDDAVDDSDVGDDEPAEGAANRPRDNSDTRDACASAAALRPRDRL